MESNIATSQTANLKVNIVLETKEDGSAIASILEFPQYRVEAGTREQALCVNGILVTRNVRDFSQVPNLVLENWTL
jgi:hypothetical protein